MYVTVQNGIKYFLASDVISEIKSKVKKTKKYYYHAMLFKNQVLIGDYFEDYTTALAYAKTMLNNSKMGVFASSSGYAQSLARSAGKYYGAWKGEIHGALGDYQWHTHPMKTSSNHYAEHIWYAK